MTGQGNGQARAWPRGAVLLLAGLALAGCGGTGSEGGATASLSPASARSGTADVLAPEVFQVAEPGLWDGRPSLGGIWVAHPAAGTPERVRIVNRTNGQEIVGALFRRERDLPGPALQVSSDAALALGMLAGAPAELEVTALRREEAPAAASEPEPAAAPEPAEAAPTGTEVAEALGTEPAEAPPVDPAAPAADPDADADAAAPAEPAPADAPVEAAPARTGFFGSIGRALGGGRDAEPVPAAGAIATSALDAPPAEAAATEVATAPTQAPAAQAPAAAAPQSYIQLGLFDVQSNAMDAAQALAAQGLPAGTLEENGAWRLLLGPAATPAEEAALLEAAVAAGFADAYLVRL